MRTTASDLVRVLCAVAWAALGGCIEEKCDPGYVSRAGACYPTLADAGVLEPRDAGDADGGDEADRVCADGEGFGTPCVDADDCSCGTQCVPVLNICTVLNCEDTPDACPSAWQCRDLRQVSPDPGVTSVCLET